MQVEVAQEVGGARIAAGHDLVRGRRARETPGIRHRARAAHERGRVAQHLVAVGAGRHEALAGVLHEALVPEHGDVDVAAPEEVFLPQHDVAEVGERRLGHERVAEPEAHRVVRLDQREAVCIGRACRVGEHRGDAVRTGGRDSADLERAWR